MICLKPEASPYYFIYQTTNILTGKIYIGMHKSYDLSDGYLGSGKLLKRAINKYGEENFKLEILCYCSDSESLSKLEAEILTLEFVDTNKEILYNISSGGWGGSNRGKSMSVEHRAAISLSHKLKHKNDKEWHSKRFLESSLLHRGKTVKSETKEKQRNSHLGKKFSDSHLKSLSEWQKCSKKSEDHKRKIGESRKRSWEEKRKITNVC